MKSRIPLEQVYGVSGQNVAIIEQLFRGHNCSVVEYEQLFT